MFIQAQEDMKEISIQHLHAVWEAAFWCAHLRCVVHKTYHRAREYWFVSLSCIWIFKLARLKTHANYKLSVNCPERRLRWPLAIGQSLWSSPVLFMKLIHFKIMVRQQKSAHSHSYCADLLYVTMASCMCNANEQMNQTDCFSNMKWGGMMQVCPRCSKGFYRAPSPW